MQERPARIDENIVELIKQTVRESMEPFGLRDVSVRAGEDHDGDPVILSRRNTTSANGQSIGM